MTRELVCTHEVEEGDKAHFGVARKRAVLTDRAVVKQAEPKPVRVVFSLAMLRSTTMHSSAGSM